MVYDLSFITVYHRFMMFIKKKNYIIKTWNINEFK